MTDYLESTLPAELRAFAGGAGTPPAKPFRSIEPLRFADAGLLAARDREREQLVRLVTMYRGTLLYGESGTGKSSLINAGALPRLVQEGLWPHRVRVRHQPGQELWLERITVSDASDDPRVRYLPSAFADASAGSGEAAFSTEAFFAAVEAATSKAPILLVFDQFEELVTLFRRGPALTDQQQAIVDLIIALLRGHPRGGEHAPSPLAEATIPVKLLFAFREDYLASLKPLLERRPELIHQSVRLAAPPLDRAADIIRAPFTRFPGHYRPDLSPLADRIAAELGKGGAVGETPLSELQIVCQRLYEAPGDPAVALQRGIKKLLEEHLRESLAAFEGRQRDAAIAILDKLVTPSGTRNVVAFETLVNEVVKPEAGLDRPVVESSLGILEHSSGLIRRELRHDDLALYELTSEFLIPWIRRQRAALEAARAETERAEQRRQQERKVRRQRIAIGIAIVIALVLATLAFKEIKASEAAHHQQHVTADLGLAAIAQNELAIEPDASLVLALAAFHGDPGQPEVRNGLISALEQARLSRVRGILHGSRNTITGVAFDPHDPNLLATAGAGGTVRLWNAGSGRLANRQLDSLHVFPAGIASLAFSPDGRTLAVGGNQGYLRFVTVSNDRLGKQLGPRIQVAPGIVVSVAYSRNGDLLAAAGLDAGVTVMTLVHGRPAGAGAPTTSSLPASVGRARAVAFSPAADAKLAVVTDAGTVQLWDGRTHRPLTAALRTPGKRGTNALYAVAFDPSGSHSVAVAGLDGNVYSWRSGASSPLRLAEGTHQVVKSLAFSPDGGLLAAGLSNAAVDVWHTATGKLDGLPLLGHDGVVTAVAFSPGAGRTLATGSTDRTVWLWRMPHPPAYERVLAAGVGPINSIAFDAPGGSFLAAGRHGIASFSISGDSPAPPLHVIARRRRILSLAVGRSGVFAAGTQDPNGIDLFSAGGTLIKSLKTPRPVGALASDPRGAQLAFSDGRGQVFLWRYPSGRPRPFVRASDTVYSIAFSPDGRRLATGGENQAIDVWRVDDGAHLGQLTGDTDAIFSVAFTPNGAHLASGGADNTVRQWSVAGLNEVGTPLLGPRNFIRSLAYDPNPKRPLLAAASLDGTLRLWNTGSNGLVGKPLVGSGAGLEAVAFSPHGKNVVTGGDDGHVRIWPLVVIRSYRAMRAEICKIVGGGLPRLEWNQFAPASSYTNPCPTK
jgi:WD40 repeat protein